RRGLRLRACLGGEHRKFLVQRWARAACAGGRLRAAHQRLELVAAGAAGVLVDRHGAILPSAGGPLLHLLLGSLADLREREFLLVRRDIPNVPERILDGARAVAVELVLYGARELAAGGHGLLHRSVHVSDIK